jgi:hypothetical protein
MTIKPMTLITGTLLALTMTGPAWTADVPATATDGVKQQTSDTMQDQTGATTPKMGAEGMTAKATDEGAAAEAAETDEEKVKNAPSGNADRTNAHDSKGKEHDSKGKEHDSKENKDTATDKAHDTTKGEAK